MIESEELDLENQTGTGAIAQKYSSKAYHLRKEAAKLMEEARKIEEEILIPIVQFNGRSTGKLYTPNLVVEVRKSSRLAVNQKTVSSLKEVIGDKIFGAIFRTKYDVDKKAFDAYVLANANTPQTKAVFGSVKKTESRPAFKYLPLNPEQDTLAW
jgi:hypothetical protein